MFSFMKKTSMPSPDRALPGRPDLLPTAETHAIFGRKLGPDYPEGFRQAVFGMGCFSHRSPLPTFLSHCRDAYYANGPSASRPIIAGK